MLLRIDGDLNQETRDALEDLLDEAGVTWSLSKDQPSKQKSKKKKPQSEFPYPSTGSQRWHALWAFRQRGSATRSEIYEVMRKKNSKISRAASDARIWELGPNKMGFIGPTGNKKGREEILELTDKGKKAMEENER